MCHSCPFLLSLSLMATVFSSEGAEVQNLTVSEGQNCTLPCPKLQTLEVSVLEWECSDLKTRLLVVRGGNVLKSLANERYRNRVQLEDLQLHSLSVVLQEVTAEDSGTYQCQVLYENEETTSQSIRLIVTKHTEEPTEEPTAETTQRPPNIWTEVQLTLTLRGLFCGLVIGLCSVCVIVIIVLGYLIQRKRSKSEKRPALSSDSSSLSSVSSTQPLMDKPPTVNPPPAPAPPHLPEMPEITQTTLNSSIGDRDNTQTTFNSSIGDRDNRPPSTAL